MYYIFQLSTKHFSVKSASKNVASVYFYQNNAKLKTPDGSTCDIKKRGTEFPCTKFENNFQHLYPHTRSVQQKDHGNHFLKWQHVY